MSKTKKANIVYAVAQSDYDIFEAAFSAVYSSRKQAEQHADEFFQEMSEAGITDCYPVVYECPLDQGDVFGPVYTAGKRDEP